MCPCSKSKMKDFGGETPYSVMFGPDICGFGTRKTHVIFNYKEKNHLVKKDIKCETDQLSHVYTLRLMPNNTYEVRTAGLCQPAL
jgi:calreticulin